jgi:uridine phosphorylase
MEAFKHESSRGFYTFTGTFGGVPMSVVTSLMGYPNMDIMVRELRMVVDGEIGLIRFGSSGGLGRMPAGGVAVATEGSIMVQQNVDAFHNSGSKLPPYLISKPVLADSVMSATLEDELSTALAAGLEKAEVPPVVPGLNVTADSFYSSQGRDTVGFDDRNDDLVKAVMDRYPHAVTFEMETFQLLLLAATATPTRIRATAAAMALNNRETGDLVDADAIAHLEHAGAQACFSTLAKTVLEGTMTEDELAPALNNKWKLGSDEL